ncbi:MAG: beta-galactosidase [Sandaracinus sp.]
MTARKRPSARRSTSTTELDRRRAPALVPERRVVRVGDREIPFLAGAVHYFRLERAEWRAALAEVAALGLPMVETYVPWGVHELSRGAFDFGPTHTPGGDPQKDLGAFLELAKELGLYVIVRPGPHINSEMTWFGLPPRVIHDRACQARGPNGGPVVLGFPPRMFPVPSYASETFLAEADVWLEAFAEVVQPHVFPRGPVVLLQIDNEAAYYFRDSPYDQDYHPDAITAWRAYLKERHPTLAELRRAHDASYESYEACEPPKRFDLHDETDPGTPSRGLALHLEWASFREHLIERALLRLRETCRAHGLSYLPTFHNLPLGELMAPMSLAKIEDTVGFVGLDYYHARREHRAIKRRTLYLAGTSRMPVSPELGVGAPPWFTPLAHEDSMYTALVALAYGLRGFSLYMAVDRDRWYGAPIDRHGTPRIEAAAWKALVRALEATRFHRLARRVRVALVVPREYVRLARATHVYGGVTPVTLEAVTGSPIEGASDHPLGMKGPIQVLFWKMIARFADALQRAGEPYVIVDSDASPERLEGIQAIVTPSFEMASPERWKALTHFANEGGHVVYGPAMPSIDPTISPRLFEVPRLGTRVLVDRDADADAAVRELLGRLGPQARFSCALPIEVTLHEDEGGPRVLFVINPEQRAIEAQIEVPFAIDTADVLTGEVFSGDRVMTVPMAPQTCRMLRVDRAARPDAAVAGGEAMGEAG